MQAAPWLTCAKLFHAGARVHASLVLLGWPGLACLLTCPQDAVALNQYALSETQSPDNRKGAGGSQGSKGGWWSLHGLGSLFGGHPFLRCVDHKPADSSLEACVAGAFDVHSTSKLHGLQVCFGLCVCAMPAVCVCEWVCAQAAGVALRARIGAATRKRS